MGEGGNEEGGMHHTTLVRTALFVLCAACRYSAADRDRTGDYRLLVSASPVAFCTDRQVMSLIVYSWLA